MAPYIPIFPSRPPSPSRRKALRNDVHAVVEPIRERSDRVLSYMERLAEQYTKLAALPFELAPSSRPASPSFTSNALKLHGKITRAIEDTNYNSSDPKWGHVTKLVRMAATSRRQGCAPGVRVGEKVDVDYGDYVFVLPDTEEEWEHCEKRWAARKLSQAAVVDGERKGTGKGKIREHDTKSEYWAKSAHKKMTSKVDVLAGDVAMEPKDNSKTEHSKQVPASLEQGQVKPAETPVYSVHAKPGKTLKQKRQSPLDFPVVKHTGSSTTTKPSQGSGAPLARRSESLADVQMLSPDRPRTPAPPSVPSVLMEESSPLGIADMSEASFLPPSFPSHLETSTPKDGIETVSPNSREKRRIPPIYPHPFLASSPPSPPLSNWSPFDPAHPSRRSPRPIGVSSSLPIISPSSRVRAHAESRPLKRSRPLTPPDDDVFISGVTKKLRTTSPLDSRRPEPSAASLPPQSPSPITTPPLSKSTSPSRPAVPRTDSGLGNAKGLPLFETPGGKGLPYLTELLASSRRSKPRPRPPSRKSRPSSTDATADDALAHHSQAQVVDDNALPMIQQESTTPDHSPAKTYFSSPASGSSQSTPPSQRRRPRSPISPLFGASGVGNVSRFSPLFTSTQHRHPGGGSPPQSIFKRGFGGAAQSESQLSQPQGLFRGSSGFFGMYNSQFDVEAQVGHVTELLDRDVDFNEYLKDVDEIEEEEEDGKEREKAEEIIA